MEQLVANAEVAVQPARRRRHSTEFKTEVLRAAMQPHVSVAAVALTIASMPIWCTVGLPGKRSAKATSKPVIQPMCRLPNLFRYRLRRRRVCGDGRPRTSDDLIFPSDSAGFYWSKMEMAQYADRDINLQRRVVSAMKPPHHRQPDPSPPVEKIYYHSDNFHDASAAVNYPAGIGNQNSTFNGYVARCVGFAQTLAVVGEPWFYDVHGATLSFPEGRLPRRG